MTYRGALRGLGLGTVARFSGDAAKRATGFPADILAAALDVWVWNLGTTPDAVGDISAWAGRKGVSLIQGTAARQPARTATDITFVLAETHFMSVTGGAVGGALLNAGSWWVAWGGELDSTAGEAVTVGWFNIAVTEAVQKRLSNHKLITRRRTGGTVQHASTNALATPQEGYFYSQGLGGTLADTVAGYLDGTAMAPAAVTGTIDNTQSTVFSVGNGTFPPGMRMKWAACGLTPLTAAQHAALLAWHDAGAIW